jgi:hypothetical protein
MTELTTSGGLRDDNRILRQFSENWWRKSVDSKSEVPPYDRCDYRCDTCIHPKTCKLYQKEHQESETAWAGMRREASIENVLSNVKKSLLDTLLAIQSKAESIGTSMDESDPDLKFELPPSPNTFPIYQLAYEFTMKCHKFLTDYWNSEPPDEEVDNLQPELDDISWQHTLVSVKLARALTSQWDGDNFGQQDAKYSVEVALRALRLCRMAMGNMLERFPGYFDELIDLILMTDKIKSGIQDQFSRELQ